ncbi:MAG TPA: energy transducer TonB [Chitinophagaceae bacterium]
MRLLLSFFLLISSFNLISQTDPPPPLVDTIDIDGRIFERVDMDATFPGGEAAWRKYLEQNLNPNVPVENGAPIGIYTVIVQFIVDKTGALSDIKTLTNFGYGMEQEVIRIMRNSPMWLPARQNNRMVRAYRKQPITFVIDDESVEIIMNEKYVLYTKTDNVIRINVSRVKKEDLELTLTQGKILSGDDGNFHITVNNPGKAILYIHSRKRNKLLGSVYFVVKKKA